MHRVVVGTKGFQQGAHLLPTDYVKVFIQIEFDEHTQDLNHLQQVDNLLCEEDIVHDFHAFHVDRFLFGYDKRQDRFEMRGYDLGDDFVDDLA